MEDYQTIKSEAAPEDPLKGFPKIDVKRVTRETNELFRSYLFYQDRKGEREIQTSCCGKTVTLPRRIMTASDMQVYCGRHNEEAICPLCGRAGMLKRIGALGKKKNLLEYQPVVVLNAKRGELYARAYWARKDYEELTAPPKFMLSGVYHFKPGRAVYRYETIYSGWIERVCEGRYNPNQRKITEPFTEQCMCGYRYIAYHVIGLEAIEKSAFRYCQYGVNIDRGPWKWDLMKYLAACCVWPRDIEMLQKMGVNELVEDLICGRKIHKQEYKWGCEGPKTAFDLNGKELREWMQYKDLDMLRIYKRLRWKKLQTSFETIRNIQEAVGPILTEQAVKICCELRERPERVMRYLTDYMGEAQRPMRHSFGIWKDYIEMQRELGRDLTPRNVRFPHDLHGAHDAAAEELAALMRQRAQIERAILLEDKIKQEAINRKLVKNREKRFNFEYGEYFIRVAMSAEEIQAEGKTLQHCVAGYAWRHMEGKTTILFLRKISEPNTPLYTIEILNGKLQQVHGFRNDRDKPDPRVTMAWILEPWEKWWKSGSKRDKQGNPILKKERKSA